jgi:SAM-dependent methyltransferase
MDQPAFDPKAGEKTYYAQLGAEGLQHARGKPFSDADCGKYLCNLGALLLMLEAPPRSVLDFGCGTGWTSLFLARAGYHVLGVDIAEDAIAVARDVAAESGVTRVDFRAADYEGFQVETLFDYVLFYDALHHAEDEQAAVDAAFRALKPGGAMFAFEPGAGHSGSAGARHAVDTYGVHEKDMPPAYVWRLGRRAGFRRKLFLPLPHEVGRGLYRRDYGRAKGRWDLTMEKLWGYFRASSKVARTGQAGLTVLWK